SASAPSPFLAAGALFFVVMIRAHLPASAPRRRAAPRSAGPAPDGHRPHPRPPRRPCWPPAASGRPCRSSRRSCSITAQQGAQTGTTGLVEVVEMGLDDADGAIDRADRSQAEVGVEVADAQPDAMTNADGRQTTCADMPAQRGLSGVPPARSLGDGDDVRTLGESRHDGPLLSVRNEHLVEFAGGLPA